MKMSALSRTKSRESGGWCQERYRLAISSQGENPHTSVRAKSQNQSASELNANAGGRKKSRVEV
jgi:hypothetical protein